MSKKHTQAEINENRRFINAVRAFLGLDPLYVVSEGACRIGKS